MAHAMNEDCIKRFNSLESEMKDSLVAKAEFRLIKAITFATASAVLILLVGAILAFGDLKTEVAVVKNEIKNIQR